MANRYLVVDVETTGAFVGTNNILCFAAVVASEGKIEHEFLAYIKVTDNHTIWEPRCVTEFWDKNPEMRAYIFNQIKCNGRSINDAIIGFYEWVKSLPNKENITVYSDNVAFDIGFLNYYLAGMSVTMNTILGEYKPVRDSSSFHAGIAHLTPDKGLWGAETAAVEKLGYKMPNFDVKHDHNPLNDAKHIAFEIMEIERQLKEVNKKELKKN